VIFSVLKRKIRDRLWVDGFSRAIPPHKVIIEGFTEDPRSGLSRAGMHGDWIGAHAAPNAVNINGIGRKAYWRIFNTCGQAVIAGWNTSERWTRPACHSPVVSKVGSKARQRLTKPQVRW
jgi:hypothetical protein